MVWVSAPAGSGKTTLVASYVKSRRLPCLWYQVDEGDADTASFFYYIGLAARAAVPRKRKPLPLLTPEYLPALSVFSLRFFEKLYELLPHGSVLVFDNCQKAPPDSMMHEVLRDGLSVLPKGMSAILVSRSDPPPAFARIRATHSLGVVGWKDLRLTPDETAGIARLRWKGKVPKETVRALHGRTDGWAAGLVLLMEQSDGKAVEPRRLKGQSPENLFDYFGEEVFDGLKEDFRAFLLRSAFLPRMTIAMAEKLTGEPRTGQILSYLNRNNYFTQKHSNGDPVYEYHSLFREFLFTRAENVFPPSEVSRLRENAAGIMEQFGHMEEAARLLRDAEDWDGLARVIRQLAPSLVKQGRGGALADWIGSLPGTILDADPWLQYWMGISLLPLRPEESGHFFEEAHRTFRKQEERSGLLLTWAGVVDSVVYGTGGLDRLDHCFFDLNLLLKTNPYFPSDEIEAHVTCAMIKALSLRRTPSVDMENWARRAMRLAMSTQDIPLKFTILLNTAYYRFHGGDFQDVALLLDALGGLRRKPEISPLSCLSLCWLEAAHANMNGLHDRCMKFVTEGLHLADTTGVHLMDMLLLGHGALCSLHRGEMTEAAGFLRRMAAALASARPWEAGFYHHLAAWDALRRGDRAQAFFHSDRCLALCEETGNRWTEALALLQRACVLDANGESAEAWTRLEGALRIGEEYRMQFVRFACLLAGSYLSFRKGDEASGLIALREGLAVGREKGYVDIYLCHPDLLERIAVTALEKGIETDYVRGLVRGNALVPGDAHLDLEQWPWALKVCTLGRFELLRDGKPPPFTRKARQKPLQMLKALIALGGRDVTEEQITDLLWPDSEGDLAHQAFATTLRRLRQLVGEEKTILLRDGCLTLDPRYCWVDTVAFERLIEQAESGRKREEGRNEGAEPARLLEKAIALYKGPFLPGEAKHPWAVSLRERLRSKFLRAVGALGAHWERSGNWENAIACYRRGLEVDNLAEDFYRCLMACYKRLGRDAEAHATYNTCRKVLSASLCIQPSSKTLAVYRTLFP